MLSIMQAFPSAMTAEHEEVVKLIDMHQLLGSELG